MAGRFVYIVTIELDGAVGPIWVRAPEGDVSPEVLACLTTTLRTARFAPPRGGHPTAIDVPITLGRQDQNGGAT